MTHATGRGGPPRRPAPPEGGRDSGASSWSDTVQPGIDDDLSKLVEGEVIPRLMKLHGDRLLDDKPAIQIDQKPQASPSLFERAEPTARDVARLASAAAECDKAAARAVIDQFISRGLSLERVFIDLLGPAAQDLGARWVSDACDFAEVTVGLGVLQRLLRDFGPSFQALGSPVWHGRRALILPVPGEDHVFGALMAGEFFRRAGWDVSDEPVVSVADLGALVQREPFAIVGLSLSGETLIDQAAISIQAIRRASRNPNVRIILGGNLVIQDPDLGATLGADAVVSNGLDGVTVADSLSFASFDVATTVSDPIPSDQ